MFNSFYSNPTEYIQCVFVDRIKLESIYFPIRFFRSLCPKIRELLYDKKISTF